MPRFVYYDSRSGLLYLFYYITSAELDIEMIRQIQRGTYTLHDTETNEYLVRSATETVARYQTCPQELFYSWYQNQPLLGPYIQANGIPARYCELYDETLMGDVAAARAPPAAAVALAPAAVLAARARLPTKPHIVALMLREAIAEKKSCPISMDPITLDSVCVAPCYHCFTKESIEQWLQKNTTCPECRETCV